MNDSSDRPGPDGVPNRRVGLAGLGMMGRNHARVLTQLDSVDFVGAVDLNSDRSQFAFGRPVVADLDALLNLGVDLCVVALPTSSHVPAAQQLADRSVPSLIEKPLAATSTDCRTLMAAFARTNTPACVGHIERFNPAIIELKRRLDGGEGGKLHQISTRRVGPRPTRVKDLGVVKDLATHDLDLAMFLTGSTYSHVAAQATALPGNAHEDLVSITGRIHGGPVVNHVVNWVTPQKERHVAAVCEGGTWIANTLTGDLIWCERAAVVSEWPAVSTMRGPMEGEVIRYGLPKREPLRTELEHFAAMGAGMDHNSVSLADGLRAVTVAEAVLESSSSGETVHI